MNEEVEEEEEEEAITGVESVLLDLQLHGRLSVTSPDFGPKFC